MKINSVNMPSSVPVQSTYNSENKIARTTVDSTASSEGNGITTQQSHANEPPETFGMHHVDPEREKELMGKSIEQANATLKIYDRRIELSVHEVTKTVMYTIKDTKTDEVIAEYPPKKIQDMIAKMWELAGLFVDKRA